EPRFPSLCQRRRNGGRVERGDPLVATACDFQSLLQKRLRKCGPIGGAHTGFAPSAQHDLGAAGECAAHGVLPPVAGALSPEATSPAITASAGSTRMFQMRTF